MMHRFPIVLLALIIPSALVAQIADPVTAAERGLRGRVGSEIIYAVDTVRIQGIGVRRVYRLAERILYDGKGRAIEHLFSAGDSSAPMMATYDYDPGQGFSAARLVPVKLQDESILMPSSDELAARTLFYSIHSETVRRAGGKELERPIARVARHPGGAVMERISYLYDPAGELIGDSTLRAGTAPVLRSYLRDAEHGMVRSTFIGGGSGAPRLTMMEEIAPDGTIERRLEFDGDRSTDTRFQRGWPVSSVTVQGDLREEICTEYEFDRHGNWVHSWSWRRIEADGKVRWEPGPERVRLLRYY